MTQRANLMVVDTSVVSILFNNQTKASDYADILDGYSAFISFQTLEERLYGAYHASWGARRISELNAHLVGYNVIWPNQELVEISARIRSRREQRGTTLHVADAWIAATALLLDCPLVADDGDFENIPNLDLRRI